jgi:hypothetical protein
MSQPNPIIDILRHAQGGNLIVNLAAAAGIDTDRADAALDILSRAIARKIAARMDDPERYEGLLDILDDDDHDEYLDDPGEILSRDAVEDGEEILRVTYGSLNNAHRATGELEIPHGVEPDVFRRLMTLAATLTLAAMARRKQLYQIGITSQSGDEPAERGFIASMISAIITGFVEGFRQAITRKRSRRRSRRTTLESIFGAGRSTRRSMRSRRTSRSRKRRRSRTPSLDDLLGDVLKG